MFAISGNNFYTQQNNLIFESLVDFAPFSEWTEGAPCTYCKACRTKGHPGKIIADHSAEVSSVFLFI